MITQDLHKGFLSGHPGFQGLSSAIREEMSVVSQVFPFQVNNYVVDELIDWSDPFSDPIFRLTFPQRGMLSEDDFAKVHAAMRSDDGRLLRMVVSDIRSHLNPHPSGQLTVNVPELSNGDPLSGVQHKFQSTVLFFPRQGQTCHSYCNFCFRWPQFIGEPGLRIEAPDIDPLLAYLRQHPEVSDVLFTGGDPFIMRSGVFRRYVDALLDANLPQLKVIRFGTKAFTYWPFRFTSDEDAPELLSCLKAISAAGKHASIIAHFNHPKELESANAQQALKVVRAAGVEVRTQSPLLRGINDDARILANLWGKQVELGCVPYYLYSVRDTGAQRYFGVPLAKSLELYASALRMVTGLTRTVRGPVMSCDPGKVQLLGISDINAEKVFVLQLLRARDSASTGRIFYAAYDPQALWISELKPAFGEKHFFYE